MSVRAPASRSRASVEGPSDRFAVQALGDAPPMERPVPLPVPLPLPLRLSPFVPRPRVRSISANVGFGSIAAALAFGLALSLSTTARGQVGPEESARLMKPAPGLKATLFAAEPMVINPTNIDVDSRGRVWVTEGLNYRLYRNEKGEIERRGDSDYIKILEDTNGDGKADKVTIFADRIYPVPMGIAVEERYDGDGKYVGCKVYVGNSPDILVLEDTNGDDKADKRYPLLTGFGGIDSDHGVHGMFLGLDGKLYFTHGDGCCSVQPDKSQITQNFNVLDKSGRRVVSDQLANTLRVNRDGTQFEILADRQRNNYEVALNSFGNAFVSDNDDDGNRGCRILWIMEGGKYGYRTPGSPRHWGEDVPGNVPKLVGTGNGSPCGVAVYEGDLFGPSLKGTILEAEAGTRQINMFPLSREGAAFRTSYEVLLSSDDPWFRPVDMAAAPDGSLFVADWYDAGVGGHAFRDQTTGRIYRVAPENHEPKAVVHDFGTVEGLLRALRSPTIATQDAARRGLIERGQDACGSLAEVFLKDADPIQRARALWVWAGIDGVEVALQALADDDARIREQGIRMLGRDVSRVGDVTLPEGASPAPLAASAHLESLIPMASDPDPGVRRELILALRDVETEKVGPALLTLTRLWDGADRWYLEALGLALQKREPSFLAKLFDGNLFGDLDLDWNGNAANLALPPYFPIDRNEAYISAGEPSPPATALSKTLGLAWRLPRPEAAPILARVLANAASADLRERALEILASVPDPSVVDRIAAIALDSNEEDRTRLVLGVLTRKIGAEWAAARGNPSVGRLAERALETPALRVAGLRLVAALGDVRYGPALTGLLKDADPEVREAAVETIARVRPEGARETIERLIAEAKGRGGSDPLSEAAVRALPRFGDVRERLDGLIGDEEYPVGVRRQALKTLATSREGADRVIELARTEELPADLRKDAAALLYGHPDGEVRNRASRALPPLTGAAGRPLPPIQELLRREGNPERGREVFASANGQQACATCHRVRGRGNWIGPDLSTIGAKYGKDELIRSIVNPNDAIGYNYRTHVVALKDGQVVSGLPFEETATELVLKTADNRKIAIALDEIEERTLSDVSLMPEGLAETMDDGQLVDLVAYLATLRRPVSVVGLAEVAAGSVDPETGRGADGSALAWRRATADAESRIALPGSGSPATMRVPIVSPIPQSARIVLDAAPGAEVRAWLDGRPLAIDDEATVELPAGRSELLVETRGGSSASIAAAIVSDKPVEFQPGPVADAGGDR